MEPRMERSTLDNVFSFITALPQGHDKPAKHALYNALALFALFLCCGAGYGLYVILGPFIKPLIWALLVGSVLHPFKCSLAKRFRSWFDHMEESGTPIFIGIFLVPVHIVDDVSEFIGSRLLKYIKHIAAIAIAIPLFHIIYYYTPRIFICLTWKFASYTHALIVFVIGNATSTAISVILIGYVSLMAVLWSPQNNKKFHCASILVWLAISCFLAHQFGSSFQTPVFVALQFIFLAGFIYEVYDIHEEMIAEGHHATILESLSIAFHDRYKNMDKLPEAEDSRDSSKVELVSGSSGQDSPKNQSDTVLIRKNTSVRFDESPLKEKDTDSAKDPWTLDLYENSAASTSTSTDSERPLAPSPSKSKVTKQPSEPSVSDAVQRNRQSVLKFKRSYSQPQVSTYKQHSSLFSYLQKPTKYSSILMSRSKLGYSMQYASDFYLYSLFWACGVMTFYKNMMLIPILIIPFMIYLIKHIGIYLGIWSRLFGYWKSMLEVIGSWCTERYDAIIPCPIRGVYKVVHKVNINFKQSIKESIDTVSSCVVILGLLVFVVCSSIFIAIQIYTEGIMLVQMTSNLINQTVVHNPELRQLLPPSFDDTVDSIFDNAYQYGREGISKVIRGMMTDVDSNKSAKLENQVLELWDRLYQTWMSSDSAHGPKVTPAAIRTSWDSFIDDIQKSPEMFNYQNISEFLKQNIGTFITLVESVWSILKGNISLMINSFSAFLSILLGGGTAVFNFILNVIVFLTTLFYLLSSSGDLYKPVEIMTNFSSSGSRFGLALEGAVNGVFKATFKMAAFYGMWTWLIHNWFGVKIVYLPSALAAILGAVPFLGTYWACVPAALDLWLAQGRGFCAFLLAICQFLPTMIVDLTIYNEIQGGGHPYLTGLAIAGGIFCLGVEGAIIGPLLLCALYVAMDLSSTLFRDSPSEEALSIRKIKKSNF